MLSRRHLFGASAVAVAVVALPSVAASSPSLHELERERNRLYVEVNAGQALSNDACLVRMNRAAEIETLIAEAPCRSREDALIKLRTVVQEALTESCLPHIAETSVVAGLIAYLEGLI